MTLTEIADLIVVSVVTINFSIGFLAGVSLAYLLSY